MKYIHNLLCIINLIFLNLFISCNEENFNSENSNNELKFHHTSKLNTLDISDSEEYFWKIINSQSISYKDIILEIKHGKYIIIKKNNKVLLLDTINDNHFYDTNDCYISNSKINSDKYHDISINTNSKIGNHEVDYIYYYDSTNEKFYKPKGPKFICEYIYFSDSIRIVYTFHDDEKTGNWESSLIEFDDEKINTLHKLSFTNFNSEFTIEKRLKEEIIINDLNSRYMNFMKSEEQYFTRLDEFWEKYYAENSMNLISN